MTMVSRQSRHIVGFDVARDKSTQHIQGIVDNSPWAKQYCTDEYFGYLDAVFPGRHIYNIRNKSNTFTVEGVNADLRHYIPVLARRSRCFARKLETLQAVLAVFQEAYNRFGKAKKLWS
jgi:IS1 family transposase